MARGRSPGYDDQRGQILAAAAQLFARQGYVASSMNEVAAASGLSKATLYHYFRDKHSLLFSIADEHVARLRALVSATLAREPVPERRLRELIRSLVEEYASAEDAHRVLTEEVKFLETDARARVLATEREIVAGFAAAVAAVRPELAEVRLTKPLTMLLFGMINWMFTWVKPGRELDYDALAPIVADLFVGGLRSLPLQQPAAVFGD